MVDRLDKIITVEFLPYEAQALKRLLLFEPGPLFGELAARVQSAIEDEYPPQPKNHTVKNGKWTGTQQSFS